MALTVPSPATLVLEDGTVFRGRAFGAPGEACAEIIFHTGMTGYQEVITDPSYRGQMVIMTYPLIGNYGVNAADSESERPHVSAFVVRELSRIASNYRSEESLSDYLARYGIPGIEGIDTRALVLHLRSRGAMRAIVSTERHEAKALREAVMASPSMEGQNLVTEVGARKFYEYCPRAADGTQSNERPTGSDMPHVVAMDFGAKRNILDLLCAQGLRVTIAPAEAPADEILARKPDGIFLSNGPGDPATLTGVVAQLKQLMGKAPIFGICLGHQLLGLASGGTTYKLKFGHHGANHPVKDLLTNKVEITSQNHGFCVDAASLAKTCSVTHMNLNDGTLEGFEDETNRFFAVQYHPEAAPGPHDSAYLFKRFREWIDRS